MSEEILRVFLGDLKTIRIICQHCKTTIETNVADVGNRMRLNKCPICGKDYSLSTPSSPTDYNVFKALEEAFRHLESIKDKVVVEFPVKIQ